VIGGTRTKLAPTGEEELAADLRPAVYAGKFEGITNAVGA
jgi:hypothetical protein